MLSERDLVESKEAEERTGEAYLKGMVDFIKWTTTITVAAVIWIGGQAHSLVGMGRLLVGASVVVFLFSLIIAVLTMKRVLNAWAAAWNLAIKDETFVLLKKIESLGMKEPEGQRVHETITELLDAPDTTRVYARPGESSRG